MKKIVSIFVFFFSVILFSPLIALAQQSPPTEWIRIYSDNGEFSIEVPAKYNYFYDEEGFRVAKKSDSYKLEKMSMLNAYHEDALLSFECYEAKKGGLDAIYENDKMFPKEAITSDFKRDDATIRQITAKTPDYWFIRQYFNSQTHIYILTVASREGENTTTKRFMDSLNFKPGNKEKLDANVVLFSSLKVTPVSVTNAKKETTDKPANAASEQIKDEQLKLILVKRPIPAYTDVARMKGVRGTIQLRLTFGEDGFIPKIGIIKSLPEGLLRQAIFAALRIKFLPEEKAKKTISVKKAVEYSFSLY